MAKRSAIARDLRSPKYRPRIVQDKKKARDKRACRYSAQENSDMSKDLKKFLHDIAEQDEFTGATPDNLPLYQAYAILNSWRKQAKALLNSTQENHDG